MSATPDGSSSRDDRPFFAAFVTGHRNAVPYGPWFHSGLPAAGLTRPEVIGYGGPLVSYLDGVLRGKRHTHRVCLYCRGWYGPPAGVDELVRCYAAARGYAFLPVHPERVRWGDLAPFRRDAETVIRSNAVVWYGERESDGDPVRVAELLGIPFRVVPAAGMLGAAT